MSPLKIIGYQPQHQLYFEALNRHWITKYFEIEPGDEYVLKQPEKAIINTGGAILVALYEDRVAGTVGLKKVDDTTFELTKMAVDEGFQRKGIAEMLSYSCFEKAKELGASTVILYSNSKLKPAITLYEKLGFTFVPISEGGYKRSDVKMMINIEKAEQVAKTYYSTQMQIRNQPLIQ